MVHNDLPSACLNVPNWGWEALTFSGGERIFREGDASDSLYVIDCGTVRIELEHAELDSESVLALLGVGEYFGEQGILDGGKRSASAIAESDVRLRRLSNDVLERLVSENPAVLADIFRALGKAVSLKLRATNEAISRKLSSPTAPYVDGVVDEAIQAQHVLATLTEDRLDHLLDQVAGAVAREAKALAELTVEVTRMGSVTDKERKNQFASAEIAAGLKGQVGCGVIDPQAEASGTVIEIGDAAGVVFGLIPVTNPVATAAFKTLICLKSRNAVILSFPRRATAVGEQFGHLIQQVLRQCKLPSGVVTCVTDKSSRRMTETFFKHAGIDLILATGGRSMVEAAYRSGKPAYGVGPGNAPVLICEDAKIENTASAILLSKTFDHGLICGSEHNLIVVASVRQGLVTALEAGGGAVLKVQEVERFRQMIVSNDGSSLRRRFIGRSASEIAAAAKLVRPTPIRLIIVPGTEAEIDNADFVGGEKMAPILSLFTAKNEKAGIELAQKLLAREGRGHTAVVHTENRDRALAFASAMPVSRVLVNSPATQGVIGQTTGLEPSLVLSCGFYGGNSSCDNIGFRHVRNLKRLAFLEPPTIQ